MIRRPPRSTRTAHSFPTRRSADLRFALRLHRHHDVEALLAHLPDLLLEVGLDGLHHAALALALIAPAEAKLRHHVAERGEAAQVLLLVLLGELDQRSEEHTSELQSLMRISYAVSGLKKKNT